MKEKKLKAKLTPEQWKQLNQADRMRYRLTDGKYHLSLGKTRALVKAYNRAEKFALLLKATLPKRHYLSQDLTITTDKKQMLIFRLGFDVPNEKIKRYQEITGLQFEVEQFGKPVAGKGTSVKTAIVPDYEIDNDFPVITNN